MPFSDPQLRCTELAALEQLVRQRSDVFGDARAAVDAHIWQQFGQRRAVMFTDLAGFSRQVDAFGVLHFLQVIQQSHSLFEPIIATHKGLLVKVDGDSLLVTFDLPQAAVDCALAMQAACVQYNTDRAPEDQVLLCVGIGYGDVLCVGDIDIFGAQVNAAAKLGEDIAKAGEVYITESVYGALASQKRWIKSDVVPPGAREAWRSAGA
jgi:adenylate cyclase